ncbi:hypothetical protein [Sphingobium yanoikuyae]|uniref:hypothetical protein n=1 Tax=Sphingobium yanoikuyae TaxID=13690 RepID=UPI000262B743|nr:hypothetical protein [Sphingobium yanoikuyae]
MQPFNRSDESAPTSLSDERASSAREALRDIFNTDQKRLAQTQTGGAARRRADPHQASWLEQPQMIGELRRGEGIK